MNHTCHYTYCDTEVPPRMLMCLLHWKQVNPMLQKLVWRYYIPGQEITKKVTLEYLAVQLCAVFSVEEKYFSDKNEAHITNRVFWLLSKLDLLLSKRCNTELVDYCLNQLTCSEVMKQWKKE